MRLLSEDIFGIGWSFGVCDLLYICEVKTKKCAMKDNSS